MAIGETAELLVSIGLQDRASGGISRIAGSLKGLDAAGNQIGRGMNQLGRGAFRVVERGAIAAGVGIAGALNIAGDFEEQLNIINTIAQESDAGLAAIGDGIRELARTTGADLADLTSGYYDLLSAGVDVADAQGVLTQSYKLGRGALGSTSEAVDVLTTAINSYAGSSLYAGKSTSELAVIFSDQLAQAVNDGKLKLTDIASTFADIAPIAAAAGVGLDQIAASYGLITAKGSAAGEVATQMTRAIVELLKPSADLTKLQDRLGVNFAELAREKGLVVALQTMREEAEKSGVPIQDLFGRLEGLKFLVTTTGVGFEQYAEELDRIQHSAGALDKQVAAREKGLNYSLGILKAQAKDAGITIGSALIPRVADLATRLATFLDKNRDKVELFATKLADGVDRVIDVLSKVDWAPMIRGLEVAGGIAKTAFDIFAALPGALQGTILTFAALNKVSGGLIGQGLGNIGGGLIKIAIENFAARGSTPANPLFVSDITGGLGGGGGAAAAGGRSLLGTAAKFVLGPAAAVIIGAELAAILNKPTIQPAIDFEQSQLKAVVDSKDLGRIVAGLDAIEAQQNTSDVGAQVALIASNIPFIGDALGHVGPQLEKDRQVLLDQLTELGLTRKEAEQIVEEQQKLVTKYGTEATKQINAVNALKLPLGLGNIITGQIKNAALETKENTRLTRANTADSARWAGLANSHLVNIEAKKTSFSVTVPVSVSATLSVKQALSTINTNTIITDDRGFLATNI